MTKGLFLPPIHHSTVNTEKSALPPPFQRYGARTRRTYEAHPWRCHFTLYEPLDPHGEAGIAGSTSMLPPPPAIQRHLLALSGPNQMRFPEPGDSLSHVGTSARLVEGEASSLLNVSPETFQHSCYLGGFHWHHEK